MSVINPKEQSLTRLVWVDIARGIGIILVVAGHAITFPLVVKAIFLFHMPLFFYLSGYLYRPPKYLKSFIVQRVVTLGIPYASFLFLVTIIDFTIGHFDGSRSIWLHPWMTAVAHLLEGGSELKGAYSVFWFVPCLLLTNIIYAVVIFYFGNCFDPRTLIFIALSYALSYWLPNMESPLGLTQVPLALSFFWLGNALQGVSLPKYTVPVALAVLLLGIVWAPPFNMKYMIFGLPVLSTLISISGIFIVLMASKLLDNFRTPANILKNIGRMAIVIMFAHQLILMHLRPLLPEAALFFITIMISWSLGIIFDQTRLTRIIFMGKFKSLEIAP